MLKKKSIVTLFLLTFVAIFIPSLSYAEVHVLPTAPGESDEKKSLTKNEVKFGVSVEKGGKQVTPPISPEYPSKDLENIDITEGNQTNQEGPLSIDYVSHIKFGNNHKIDKEEMVIPLENDGTPFFQVTDITGEGTGWQLRGKLGEFKNEKNHVINGAKISMSMGKLITRNSSETADYSGFITPEKVTFTSGGDYVPLMTANSDFGSGTWAVKFDEYKNSILFEAPGKNIEANSSYRSGIVWQLVTLPEME